MSSLGYLVTRVCTLLLNGSR